MSSQPRAVRRRNKHHYPAVTVPTCLLYCTSLLAGVVLHCTVPWYMTCPCHVLLSSTFNALHSSVLNLRYSMTFRYSIIIASVFPVAIFYCISIDMLQYICNM